jgi:DNA-binding NarL/FixJ family response regulator
MIRVLPVNEAGLVCDVLVRVLNDEDDLQTIGPATSADAALGLAQEADVVLVGTQLPGADALELTRRLTDGVPGAKLVVMGLEETEEEIVAFVEAGADGYVLRDDSVDELLTRVRAAQGEKALISPGVAAAIMSRVNELASLFSRINGVVGKYGDLTPRERQVLELVAKDLTNQEIADRLSITEGTVKNHVHSILRKLDVRSRQDAAAHVALVR